MSFLARRQKLIKLADRSEPGWAVMEEYDADADNLDDERTIEKTEKAAESWPSEGRCRMGSKKQVLPGVILQRP